MPKPVMTGPISLTNPSKQQVDFYYRQPFDAPRNLVAHVQIPSGGQVQVGHDWDGEARSRFIKYLESQGCRDAAEVYAKMGKFTGLLYRDNGLISEDEIVLAHDAVVETQMERSATELTRSALAYDRAANARGRGKRVVRETELSVSEELAPGARPKGNEMDFSLAVTPDGHRDVKLPL